MKLPSPFPVPRSPFPSKRGSALLIVIGMVAFMAISSVAFSIYMRTSRLPSGYLRRGTSSRMLLKSALAGAIERIDGVWRPALDSSFAEDSSEGYIEGIYDDLHPGLNPKGESSNRGDWPWTGNRFVNHVFTPFTDIAPPENPNEPEQNEAVPVSTLTLEGLAYLPPALINDVRLQSHRTTTACWCNLNYEYGRYAFCAVDVSDFFDVNKMRANSARTSAARQRIGFSTLFADEGSGLSSFDTSTMQAFDSQVNGIGNIPFVSMADFNLSFGKSAFTPFCSYIGKSGDLSILGDGDSVAANALFTTDTWFPPTNVTGGVRYDLSATQPFDAARFDSKNNAADVLNAADLSDPIGSQMRLALGGAGMVCLYDYLDADNVPTSFALPTVETAPMVCGLALRDPDSSSGALQVKVEAKEKNAVKKEYYSGFMLDKTKLMNTVTATPYELTWQTSSILLSGQAVFPFKRVADKKRYATSFKAEALVRVFLAPSDFRAYVDENSPLAPKSDDDWTASRDKLADSGYLSMPVTMTRGNPMSWNQEPKEAKDAVQTFSGAAAIGAGPCKLFYRIDHTRYDANGNPSTTTWYTLDGVKGTAPCILDADGVEAAWWKAKKSAARDVLFQDVNWQAAGIADDAIATRAAGDNENLDPTTLLPQAAVWVRLANNGGDDNGCVVDVVPAWGKDDSIYEGKHNSCDDQFITRVTCNATGESSAPHAPIIRFTAESGGFRYGKDALSDTANPPSALRWESLLAVDPRYNYSPQDWFKAGSFDAMGDVSTWLSAIQPLLDPKEGRDRDIFMFTSDQEYLQSAGELQFLPFLHDLREEFTSHVRMTAFANLDFNYQYDKFSSAEAAMDAFMPDMWKTYSAPDGDPVYTLGKPGVEIVSSVGDFRVNPFTSDDRVFRAAIANTPYDWFVASTNKDFNLHKECLYLAAKPKPSADDGAQYAFSSKAKSESAKWKDDAVYDIADELSVRLREKAREWEGDIHKRPGWEGIYDAIWQEALVEDEKKLFGVELGNNCLLHGVDRKFLHGFWRECFGTRQQLFLIFLRAEPLTVGGSGTASMANAQTGARGVALVWRDPEPPLYHRENRPLRSSVTSLNRWKVDNGHCPAPHRTRVLFYHQFD